MKKYIFITIFLQILLKLYPTTTNCIVLCYHTFLGKNFSTDFSIEEFEKHITLIKNLGYKFVSFSDILSNNISGNNNILLTIDDGNISVKNVYEKVLKKFNIKPILFIYPAITSRKYYSLTYNDLKYLLENGCEIGAHGYFHLILDENLFKNHYPSFGFEIRHPKKVLEKKLKRKIEIYAYPFGICNEFTKNELKKYGYKYAFSLKQTSLKIPIENNIDIYDLPRYMVTKQNWKKIYKILKENLKNQKIT